MLSLDLTKKTELLTLNLAKSGVLEIPVMEVRLAIDKSGSMDDEFRGGLVDRTVDLFLAAGLKFDDNGQLDVGFFNGEFEEAPTAVASDAGQYLKKAKQRAGGGTCYGPIIENFETRRDLTLAEAAPVEKKGFFGSLFGKSAPAPAPAVGGVSKYRAYTGIITDGDNADKGAFERALKATSGDTFYQFIAIGTDIRPTYLTEIAAKYKHVSFIHIRDPKRTTDEEFYEALCNEKLAAWINNG